MKTAFLLDSFPKISETFILNQITNLIDRGIDVQIFALNKSNEAQKHDAFFKYKLNTLTHYAPIMPKNSFKKYIKGSKIFMRILLTKPLTAFKALNFFKYGRDALNLRLLFYADTFTDKNRDYDVIQAHFGPIGNIALKLRETGAFKGSLVCTFHGYDINRTDIKHNPNYYQRLIKAGDCFTANSHYSADRLKDLGFPAKKIKILPNPIDCESFKHTGKKFHTKNNPINILTVGRLSEEKGHIFALEAIKQLIHKKVSLCYHIVGEGHLHDELNNFINKNHLKEFVVLHGNKKQSELIGIYKKADLFLLPAIISASDEVDTQAVVLQEAQAMQLPVIASNIGGIPEGIKNNKTGFIIEQKDTQAIAEKVLFFIKNPEQTEIMGKQAEKFIKQKYDKKQITTDLIEIYRSISEKQKESNS